jgi:enoyl-[acyl-carrier-protein] reductase (NADH)
LIRFGKPCFSIAGTVAFLLGDGAKNITGTVMTADAGSTA